MVFMYISLAITIPDEVKRTLAAAIERFQPHAEGTRWEERDQLQLPIVTIGKISRAFLPHITEAVTEICNDYSAFPVHAYGFGFFGTKRFPHNVWAAVDPSEIMNDLYEALWAPIAKFGFKKPVEAYRPHIRLGSCKGGVKNRALIDAMDADEEMEMGSWEARALTIYDCKMGKRGKVHKKLVQVALG